MSEYEAQPGAAGHPQHNPAAQGPVYTEAHVRAALERQQGGRTRKRRRAQLAVLVAAAVLAGGLWAGQTQRAAAERAADAGTTIVYAEKATWTTLYPPNVGYYPNGGIANNITDRLLYQDPKTLELHPWIAESLPEVNEDATEYTFRIRDGVTYSDGSVVDAENVARNFDLFGLGDKERKLTKSEQINNYSHSEVIDPHTVKFYFSAPSPGFAQATSTMNSGLLSNATLERSLEGFGPGNATEIIGSGPFVIAGEEIGQSLVLRKREDYNWGPPLQEHSGPALVDTINVVVAPESSVRIGALEAGQVDIARDIDAPVEDQLKAHGIGIVAAPTSGVNNGLAFRFRHPLLQDIRVRQAIIHGVDRQRIITTLFSDSYPLATSSLAHTALGYEDQSAAYTYEPETSAALLDEAGWLPGPDGIRTKDGQRLEFTVNYAIVQPRSREVITAVQEDLAKLGIKINFYPGDKSAQNAAAKNIDLIQLKQTMVGRADMDVLKSYAHTENRNELLNKLPDGSIADPELDRLLEKIASTPKEADRKAATAAAQRYIAENAYVLPIFEEPQVFGYAPGVTGFQTEAVGRPWFYNLAKTSGAR